jgi:hypothetical protein
MLVENGIKHWADHFKYYFDKHKMRQHTAEDLTKFNGGCFTAVICLSPKEIIRAAGVYVFF